MLPFDIAENPDPGSKILVNGVAKSGTHLLRKIVSLSGFQVNPLCVSAIHANRAAVLWQQDLESILGPGIVIGTSFPTPMHELLLRQLIRSVPVGWVFNGHCGYSDGLAAVLQSEGVKHLGILRDPRDICLSLVRYLVKHDHPVARGQSESELLLQVMDGVDLLSDAVLQPLAKLDLGATCQAFLPWQTQSNSLLVRFEDLVGPEGGGTLERQMESIRKVLLFIDRDVNLAEKVRDKIFGGTRTFHQGQIGSWRTVFTDTHKQKAKDVLGTYLINAGYS